MRPISSNRFETAAFGGAAAFESEHGMCSAGVPPAVRSASRPPKGKPAWQASNRRIRPWLTSATNAEHRSAESFAISAEPTPAWRETRRHHLPCHKIHHQPHYPRQRQPPPCPPPSSATSAERPRSGRRSATGAERTCGRRQLQLRNPRPFPSRPRPLVCRRPRRPRQCLRSKRKPRAAP